MGSLLLFVFLLVSRNFLRFPEVIPVPRAIYPGKVHLLSRQTIAMFAAGAEQSAIISAVVAELGIDRNLKGKELFKKLMRYCHPDKNPYEMNDLANMVTASLLVMDFSE